MEKGSEEALGGALSAVSNSPVCRTAKQDTPGHNSETTPLRTGWSVRKLKAQLRRHQLTSVQISEASGFSQQGIRLTIRGMRKGLATRQAIAQALGEEVTTIWPDAHQVPKERRLRTAS